MRSRARSETNGPGLIWYARGFPGAGVPAAGRNRRNTGGFRANAARVFTAIMGDCTPGGMSPAVFRTMCLTRMAAITSLTAVRTD
jgi:hypothetical protein